MVEYFTLDLGPWTEPTGAKWAIARVLSRILPVANPDLEPRYSRTVRWWLEVADDQVMREVGFDAEGRAIVAAPWRDNLGILTDQDGPPSGMVPGLSADAFEKEWIGCIAALEASHTA